MCDFSKGFVLCVCKNDDQQSSNNTIVYEWTLNKYIGPTDGSERGRYVGPLSDIGSGLTSDFILKNLNARNCFDFDYTPSEGDNLVLQAELTAAGHDILARVFESREAATHDRTELPITGRIEFIFNNNGWVEQHYDPFQDDVSKINSGKVKKFKS